MSVREALLQNRVALDKYSKEIGLLEPMTLEKLIESHRYLRGLNLESSAERQWAIVEGFEKGRAEGKVFAETNDYISREKLKTMTIQELVAELYEE